MSSDSDNPFNEVILGGSAYEFINTDEESRDDNTTESIASTDFGPYDDLNSLRSAESSGEEDSEENSEENNQELRQSAFSDEIIPQISLSPLTSHYSHISINKLGQPASSSIEFEESFNEGEGKICVKHTVAELDGEQFPNVLRLIPKDNPTKKVLLSVRQTMIDLNLNIKEPLRILYVGSHLARQDIIHKIATSVIALAEDSTSDKQRRYSGSQHYNVIPISAFGSENAPEIELMHSSRYQIKVDSCYSAYNIKSENSPDDPDVIRLVLDEDFTCQSIPSNGESFYIEPSWELPHIAIIYFSGGDDINIRRTRTTVREFLNRHDIPSILISQMLLLNNCSFQPLDQNSIHMCLESKDSKESGPIIYQRFPINLDTFLNIDARQINKNLAYLTGLHEPLCSPITVKNKTYDSQPLKRSGQIFKNNPEIFWRKGISIIRSTFCSRIGFLGFLSIFFVLLSATSNYMDASMPVISVNDKMVLSASRLQIASFFSVISPIILATSKLFRSSSQDASSICHMSYGPEIFPGSLNEGFSAVRIATDKRSSSISLSCTAETYGEKSILIRILGNPNVIRPKSDTISINIRRDNTTIDTDRAFGYENCLILLIPKDETYGLIDVSVSTGKELRLNETCTLDFGPSAFQILQSLKNKISSFSYHQSPNDRSYLLYHHKHKAFNVIQNFRNKFPTKILKASDTCYRAIAQLAPFGNILKRNPSFHSRFKFKKSFSSPYNCKTIKKYFAHSHITFNPARNYINQSVGNYCRKFGVHIKAKDNLHVFSNFLTETAKECSLEAARKFVILLNKMDNQALEAKKTVRSIMEPQYKRLFAVQVKSKILWLKVRRGHKEAEQYQKKAIALMQRYSKRNRGR